MATQPAPAPTTGRTFAFIPKIHPHILQHHHSKPVKVEEQHSSGFNGKLALLLTNSVGTMWCAYVFAILALIGFPWGGGTGTQYVQWLSQTFIQLVMLSVIMVGQDILGKASDKRAEETWKDADASFHTAREIQEHLTVQDAHLAEQDARLQSIIEQVAQLRGQPSS